MKNSSWWQKLQAITWTPVTIFKAALVVCAALVALVVIMQILINPAFTSLSRLSDTFSVTMPIAYSGYGSGIGGVESAASSYYVKGSTDGANYQMRDASAITLSTNNVMGVVTSSIYPIPTDEHVSGSNLEDFEVTDYSAQFEVQNKTATCGKILNLKGLEYVVFETANEYDRGCSYVFKVEHAHVQEVLAILEQLNPKSLSENTYTIKKQIDDFTSQEEILTNKLDSIDDTLRQAIAAYDGITQLATNTQNADALAKVIDSKVGVIERLTQQRIDLTAQLERLARGKAEQIDRLVYTFFTVNVYESKFVDWQDLGDSWKRSIQEFVANCNQALQGVTVGLLSFLLMIVQFVLYVFIVVLVAKFVWKAVRYIWKQ